MRRAAALAFVILAVRAAEAGGSDAEGRVTAFSGTDGSYPLLRLNGLNRGE